MSANRSIRNPSKKLNVNNTRQSPHVIWYFEDELEANVRGIEDCTGHTITTTSSNLLCNTHQRLIPSHTEHNIIECDPQEDLYKPLDYRIDWSVELKQKFSRDLQIFHIR